ncbi:MAG: hypothetical protein ACXW3C_02085 [Pyrinomonadaceae bacterium]
MKNSALSQHRRGLITFAVITIALASLPLLSAGRTSTNRAVSTSVNIVNNSSREIRNVYSSHVGSDDWSADLLGEGTISPGQSSSVSLACDASEMSVIAEDQDGCFATQVVSCGSNSTWTINNNTARDCGQ